MDFELARQKFERNRREELAKARSLAEQKRKAKENVQTLEKSVQEAQRVRRLEAAATIEKARAREEAEIEAGDGIRFSQVYKLIPISGDIDKITLPQSALSELMSQGAIDKGPMYFELNFEAPISDSPMPETPNDVVVDDGSDAPEHPDDNKFHKFAGVSEFTAPDGFIGVPSNFFIRNSSTDESSWSEKFTGLPVSVRYVRLGKGKYAKFQPKERLFFEISNHKAVLEAKLRKHSTLAVGDLIRVYHAGLSFHLKVIELKPANSVSLIDTDVDVDLIPPEESDENSNDKEIVSLELGTPVQGSVSENQYKFFKLKIDKSSSNVLLEGSSTLVVFLDLLGNPEAGDADLYVTSTYGVFPTQFLYQWCDNSVGSKELQISEREYFESSDQISYTIGVHGFRGSIDFKLRVDTREKKASEIVQKLGTADEIPSDPRSSPDSKVVCNNCRQLVPSNTIYLHEAYCSRHNIKCSHDDCNGVFHKDDFHLHKHCNVCGEPMHSKAVDKHMKLFHTLLNCTCGASFFRQEMVEHSMETCPLRIIHCMYCENEVFAEGNASNTLDNFRGLTQHESLCGARTVSCATCSRSIMLKELELHNQAVHSIFHSIPLRIPVPNNPKPSFLNTNISDATLPDGDSVNRTPERVEDARIPHIPINTNLKRSVNVQCPICGISVHSERDLSSHFDAAH